MSVSVIADVETYARSYIAPATSTTPAKPWIYSTLGLLKRRPAGGALRTHHRPLGGTVVLAYFTSGGDSNGLPTGPTEAVKQLVKQHQAQIR